MNRLVKGDNMLASKQASKQARISKHRIFDAKSPCAEHEALRTGFLRLLSNINT